MGITFSCHNLAQCSLNTNLMMQSVRKCLKSSTYQGIRSSGLWSKQCAFCYDLTLNDADLISWGNNPIQRKVTGNIRPVHTVTVFHSTIKVTFCSKFILTVHEAFLVFWLQFLQSASAFCPALGQTEQSTDARTTPLIGIDVAARWKYKYMDSYLHKYIFSGRLCCKLDYWANNSESRVHNYNYNYSYIQVPHCIETIQYLHRAVQNFKWLILGNEIWNYKLD